MIHDLKILPEYFVEVVRGNKTFEVRKDDRPFNVGDELILYEVNCGKYTGRNIKVIITYILRNPDYCKEGYCILGFKQPVKRGKWEQDEKGAFHHCSECESKTFRDVDSWGYEYQEYLTDYCFRCGARMVGEQNENN